MKEIKNGLYMIRFVWKESKSIFFVRFLIMMYGVFFRLLNLASLKIMLDGFLNQKESSFFLTFISIYVIASIVNKILNNYLYGSLNEKLFMNLKVQMNQLLHKKILSIDYSRFDDPKFFDSVSKALKEADGRCFSLYNQLFFVIQIGLDLIVTFIYVISLSPFMVIMAIISCFGEIFLGRAFRKRRVSKINSTASSDRMVGYYKTLYTNKNAVSEVKQFDKLESLLTKKFEESCDKRNNIIRENIKDNLRKETISSIFSTLIYSAIPMLYSTYCVINGIVSISDYAVLINSFVTICSRTSDFGMEYSEFKTQCAFAENFRIIMEEKSYIESFNNGIDIENDKITSIEFKNVSFEYPNNDKFRLSNINFVVNINDKIALVGVNGAGKTTIIKLISRYYDVSSGQILINGRDIREYNIASLRKNIGGIFQDFMLFSLKIGELVSCETNYDPLKVEQCLKDVGLDCKIKMENDDYNLSYSKQFDENGLILSGGECQKLAIARLLYKNPSLILSDEASSELDPISEYEINNKIIENSKDKILIMISHRLSTTINADKIIYLEQGQIIEMGTHDELMKQKGKYAYLFDLQSKEYIKNNVKNN